MRRISFGQATVEATAAAMREDPSIVVLGEDISWGGNFGQFRGLVDEFGPDRVIDMPISEALIMGASLGAALTGLRPVASMSFVEFTLGAMDEIVNQLAKMRFMSGGQVSVPVVLRASDGVLRSSAAQHSESLEGLFTHIPGLKVVAPSNPTDAKGLLRTAMADDSPVIYLEHKKITPKRGPVPEEDFAIPLGSAKVVRSGSDVTVICYSIMVQHAIAAADVLAGDNKIEVEVIDLRSLVPLDKETILESVRRTHKAVICHEAWTFGGFGAEIAAWLGEYCFDDLDAPIGRVGARRAHIPFSPVLERAIVPEAEEIVDAVRRLLAGSIHKVRH